MFLKYGLMLQRFRLRKLLPDECIWKNETGSDKTWPDFQLEEGNRQVGTWRNYKGVRGCLNPGLRYKGVDQNGSKSI